MVKSVDRSLRVASPLPDVLSSTKSRERLRLPQGRQQGCCDHRWVDGIFESGGSPSYFSASCGKTGKVGLKQSSRQIILTVFVV